jgi:3',5'-cyclic-AMP phosphodiesterase
VLHGHRHAPGEVVLLPRAGRPLRILNAGSTPSEGRARLITHVAGRVLADRWVYVEPRHAPRELAALRPVGGVSAAA